VKAGRCPVCKLVIRLNADGTLRKHRPGGFRFDVCSGSSRLPAADATNGDASKEMGS
jgi:hypothetical protein